MARGVRFLLGSRQYPFLKKNGPGIPVFGYCPIILQFSRSRGAHNKREEKEPYSLLERPKRKNKSERWINSTNRENDIFVPSFFLRGFSKPPCLALEKKCVCVCVCVLFFFCVLPCMFICYYCCCLHIKRFCL